MGEAYGPAVGAAMLAARSTGEHARLRELAEIAARWTPAGDVEMAPPGEVERLARLAPWMSSVRNALRSVGAPGAGPTT